MMPSTCCYLIVLIGFFLIGYSLYWILYLTRSKGNFIQYIKYSSIIIVGGFFIYISKVFAINSDNGENEIYRTSYYSSE